MNNNNSQIMLSPAQQQTFDQVMKLSHKNPIVGLVCSRGCGRTTILRQVAREQGAFIIRLADIFDSIATFHPLQLQEGIVHALLEALKSHDSVIVDDFHILNQTLDNCYEAARPNVLSVGLDGILKWLEKGEKRLILGLENSWIADPFRERCLYASQEAFSPEDFAFLFQTLGGEGLADLDYEKIHQFAPRLNAHQIFKASKYLTPAFTTNTKSFLEFLEAHALVSNVNKQEVEKVDLAQLYGVEDVIRQLEIDIIVPFGREDLAQQYGLQPKRGVLLYGPPGTGKTTIGRALAHRLGSKFFLIDGTVISGTERFYATIHRIFMQAKDNVPSVLFIDDCDLLFENEEETGLYRYLLTMLDGLESKTNSRVTVILTAMNIGSLPPALIRSGRVELWLEMKLPDSDARASILKSLSTDGPLTLSAAEIEMLATLTEGFTGADLRRVMTDARNLYGYDLANEQESGSSVAYWERAIRQLLFYRQQLESAPKYTAAHHPAASRKG